MADININHNINDNSARKSGGAGTNLPAVKDNSKQQTRELGNVLSKTYKEANKHLAREIESTLTSALIKALGKVKGPATSGGIAKGGGLTEAEISRIIKSVTNKGTDDLIREITKLRRSGGTRGQGGLANGTDRQIQQLLKNLGSLLGSKGIELPASVGKEIGKAVGDRVKEVLSKDFSKAAQDATKAWKEVQTSATHAKNAIEAISKIKKSGGGIDVKEIGRTLKEVKELGKSLISLKQSSTELSKTTGALVKNQRDLAKETGLAIKELRESVKKEAQKAVRDIPEKLVNKETYKKQFDDLLRKLDTVIRDVVGKTNIDLSPLKEIAKVGNDVKQAAKEMKEAAREIKDAKGLKETVKSLENATEKVSKSMGTMEEALKKAGVESKKFVNSIDNSTKKIENVNKSVATKPPQKIDVDVKKLFEEFKKEFKKFTDDAALELRRLTKQKGTPAKKIENYELERRRFVGDLQSNDPQRIKESLGRGLPGVNYKGLEDLRKKITDLEKAFDKTPKEFKNLFEKGMKGQVDTLSIEKKLADLTQTVAIGNKEAKDFYNKALRSEAAGKLGVGTNTPPRLKYQENAQSGMKDVELIKSQIRQANRMIKQPRNAGVFPQVPIVPGKSISLEPEMGPPSQAFQKASKLVKARIEEVTKSLLDLQNHVANTLTKEFDKAGRRWQIVKDTNDKSVSQYFKLVTGANSKTAGKQYALQIADIAQIKKELFSRGRPAQEGQSSKQIVSSLLKAIASDSVKNYASDKEIIDKIAEWFKTVNVEQIRTDKELGRVSKDFADIKKKGFQGEKLADAIGKIIGQSRPELEEVFKLTIGKVEAMRDLQQKKLVRTVALPAARLTETGTMAFETASGSKRALQQFAKFKTGFENIYENLVENNALVLSKNFAESIREVGLSPRGSAMTKARDLARDMLKDFGKINQDNFASLVSGIQQATILKGGTQGTDLRKKVDTAIGSIQRGPQGGIVDIDKAINDLVMAVESAGVSMYDVTKTMDSLKFLNVYDVMKQILDGTEQGLQPLMQLGKSPNFQKSIRNFESAISQQVGTLPLIEPGRPRRGLQQESVVKLLSRTGDIYKGESRFNPEQQKEYVQGLNTRFIELFKAEEALNELYSKAGKTRSGRIPEGIRTISSLGVPDALAGETKYYRQKFAQDGDKFLGQIEAVVNTMYTDILEEMNPLGEFSQRGRQGLAAVSSGMSSNIKDLQTMGKTISSKLAITGRGTEFPTLRTQKEADVISSGRIGRQGYGFNVVTEFKHVAGTMEDQILISGKLANALTAITKTLIRPSGGGRIRGGGSGGEKVEDINPKVLKDTIQKAYGEIQTVLGVPEQYKGRADKAFLDEVTKALTVLRGEEVEVQQARLTEIFFKSFGRKFFSRSGSKGVAAFPSGLAQPEFEKISKMVSQGADLKVLTPQERKTSGLGVQIAQRSIGEMLADIFGEDEASELRRQLVESGNKFMLDIFKSEKGILVPEEAKQEREFFNRVATIFEKRIGAPLKSGKEGIGQVIDLAEKKNIATREERPIDLLISSKNIAKRGLQADFLEAIINNISGVGGAGTTTVPTKLSQERYKYLLGEKGQRGALSMASESLGYTTQDPKKIKAYAEKLAAAEYTQVFKKTKDADLALSSADLVRKRAEAIETLNSFYSQVIDRYGEEQKALVGEKFFSVVEEPGQTAPWSASDVRRGMKGISLDIPSFSAYATIFGDQSALIDEIVNTNASNQKKQLEFLKALRVQADETGTVLDRMNKYLTKVPLQDIRSFEESTGVLPGLVSNDLDPRNLKSTIFDTEKFAKPFTVDIPKVGAEPGKTEPLYVPGPLARGTYEESLIAGERGVENIGRRLQHVINMSKKASALLERPGIIRKNIEELQEKLKTAPIGSPEAGALQTQLLEKQSVEKKILAGGEMSDLVRKRVIEEISKYLSKVKEIQTEGQTPENMVQLKEIYGILKSAVSASESPSEIFRTKTGEGGKPLPPMMTEEKNLEAFFKRQMGGRGEFNAYIDSIRKAADISIGKGPDAFEEYNMIVDALAELNQGKTEATSTLIKTVKDKLSKEKRFSNRLNTPKDLAGALTEKKGLIEPAIKATLNDIEKPVTRLSKSIQSGRGIEFATRFGVNIDKELQFKYEKAMDNLQKAKIEYFRALAEASIGKKGAVSMGVFRRKYPGVVKKAVVAIVDRTDEMYNFIDEIQTVQNQFQDILTGGNVTSISKAVAGVQTLTKQHEKDIAKDISQNLPVLKQGELGIPSVTAKKLPVAFKKRIEFDKDTGDITKIISGEVDATESTLYDLIKYLEKIREIANDEVKQLNFPGGAPGFSVGPNVFPTEDLAKNAQEVARKILKEEGSPTVEAIRYPVTGVSSLVPFKPKLLEGQMGEAASKTFVAPGIPNFNVSDLDASLQNIKDIVSELGKRREALHTQADLRGMPVDMAEINRITEAMSALRSVIENVTVKYQAHTAKLDFDGDTLGVHSAKTSEARKEIEKHYKSITEFDTGISKIQSRFRSAFTSSAAKDEQMGTDVVLAEAQEKFMKKFNPAAGFEFMTRPFLTDTLEYAKPREKLSILGIAEEEGMAKAFENLISDYITATVEGLDEAGNKIDIPVADKFIDAIREVGNPFKTLDEELQSVKEMDLESRFKYADQLLKAVDDVDKELGSQFSGTIRKSLTSRLFEDKMRTAVEQNLFKIETGIQTEALYRLNRLSEMNLGFGSGLIGGGGTFQPSESFKHRNPPDLKILGGDIETIAGDYYAQFNELFRFSLQKGMDVKHAGGKSVSKQIERSIARGTKGALELWNDINDPTGPFGDLQDFIGTIDEVIADRLGGIPTDIIKKELVTLSAAKGLSLSASDVSNMDRESLIKKAQEVIGFKGFLLEMSAQVKEAAIDGIVKSVSKLAPEVRANIGDPKSYARGLINKELGEGGINVREHITTPNFPLYSIRSSRRLTSQVGTYKTKYGEPTVPEGIQFSGGTNQESINDMLKKYKEAKATAVNVQDAFAAAIEGTSPGAYSKLVEGTLNNIHADQVKIEAAFNQITAEGKELVTPDRSIDYLKKLQTRASGDVENLPKMVRDALKLSKNGREKYIEQLSDLLGVPTLSQEEINSALGLGTEFSIPAELRRAIEQQAIETTGVAGSQINEEEIAKTAKELTKKAEVIYQMDRLIDVLNTRAQEGIDLLSLFPKPGSAASKSIYRGTKEKSYSFAEDMARTAAEGQASRDVSSDIFGKSRGGGGGIGGSAAGGAMYAGGVVPVKIVDISRGIGVFLGGGSSGAIGSNLELNKEAARGPGLEKAASKAGQVFETHDETIVVKRLRERSEELDKVLKNWDAHQKRFLDPKFQEQMRNFFPSFKTEGYEKRLQAGAEPKSIIKEAFGELKKQEFFGSGLKYQGGSSLGAGGLSVSDAINIDPKIRKSSQIEKISKHILGLDQEGQDKYAQAAFKIGTALHAKYQRKVEDSGKNVDIEKFVYFEPDEIVKGMQGAITGLIDIVEKDANNQIKKIVDIKTTGESFAKYETIKKFIPEGEGIDIEELLAKDIPGFLRQKLIEYSSQLNVYLAALKQAAERGEDINIDPKAYAEIAFIPSEDVDVETPPRVVKVKFDTAKLQKDMEAVQTARDLINDYIIHTEKDVSKAPEELKPIIERLRNRLGSKVGEQVAVPNRRTPQSYKFEEALDTVLGKDEPSMDVIEEAVRTSKELFDYMENKGGGVYTETKAANKELRDAVKTRMAEDKEQINSYAETMSQMSEAMRDIEDDIQNRSKLSSTNINDPRRRGMGPATPEEKLMGPMSGSNEPLIKTFTAMQGVHNASLIAQRQLNKFEFKTGLENMPDLIQQALGDATTKPPAGPEFSAMVTSLEKQGMIGFNDQIKAWKLWRIAVADFLISQARQAQEEFEVLESAGKPRTKEFETFAARVEKLREFMMKGFGKKSDIYTENRRYLTSETSMQEAGLYLTPADMFKKVNAPFEDQDELTRGVFKDVIDKLEGGVLGKPAEEIRKIVNEIGELNKVSADFLENEDMFKRMGSTIDKSLDFAKIAERARVLRTALSQYSETNFDDTFQTDVQKKYQVSGLLQYLKQIEQIYGRLDLRKAPSPGTPGLVKVPSFLSEQQQYGLHNENIMRVREFLKKPEAEGGAKIGEKFSYFMRIVDESGTVLKNRRYDFSKYREAIDDANQSVGRFTETHRDLVGALQTAGGTFQSALKRVIMWGSAATLVYGGVQKLKESIDDLAAIEVSIAQLRMVMNPITTDFDDLTRSAVRFAKDYGVGINEVLKGMKIFAQQGLSQSEVIDRTRVSTLAANVTTLSASDATEALTAAMKSFGGELGTADMALDSWSETEAKHAITAADMANAIKKSAAAAKNAGFTFNELNGIVAGIGAVTRQTGKEVGTAIRFIARRLFSEKGPKVLGEVGIPVVTETGDLRSGFKILDELAGKWSDLTNAQQLNIAQSLGGTRQYNSVLVAMQNWNEVLSAIEHSTNSKGSAERRNLELMKTYQKQVEQMKAAATELSMEFGKIAFPVFKGFVAAAKTLLEVLTAIPTPIKVLGTALTLFFGYAAKGAETFDYLFQLFDQGAGTISNFIKAFKSESKIALFEVFGQNKIPLMDFLGIDTTFKLDARNLKTMAPGALSTFKPKGTTFMDRLGEFQSPLGKLAYTLKTVGDSYNELLVSFSKGGVGVVGSAAKGLDKVNSAVQGFALTLSQLDGVLPIADILAAGVGALSTPTEALEQIFKAIESMGGPVVRKFAESFAAENSGIVKSILPLAATIFGAVKGYDALYASIIKSTGTAQDYAKAMHNTRDAKMEDLKSVQDLSEGYNKLSRRLEKAQRDQKSLRSPGELEKRVDLKDYRSPMLELARIQDEARKISSQFLDAQLANVAGVDKFGNAILNTNNNLKSYIDTIEQTRLKEVALVDVDIASKYVEDLTTEGSKMAQEIGAFLSELPLVGELNFGKTPFKMLNDARDQVNKLLSLKQQYPLSTVIEGDLKKALEVLNKAKGPFDETFSDFKKSINSIQTSGLNRSGIVDIFRRKELKSGFELIAEYENELYHLGVTAEDVIGMQIMKRVFPESGGLVDINAKRMIESAREAGIQVKKVTEGGVQISPGHIVTFKQPNKSDFQSGLGKFFDAAGDFAIVKIDELGNTVLEYYNKMTGELEVKPIDDPVIQKIADSIIPVRQIAEAIEDRIAALSTAVTGAASGISGIADKQFKKEFDLGARFYSQLPTSTLMQSPRGFVPGSGLETKSPLKTINLPGDYLATTGTEGGKLQQKFFSDLVKTYFLDPLDKYNASIKELSKLELTGPEEVNLAKKRAQELEKARMILMNNQVGVQYIALFEDLNKTLEENSRTIKENIDIEQLRQRMLKQTSGFLEGMPESLDNINTGVRKLSELSNKQRTQLLFPQYNKIAGTISTLQRGKEGRTEAATSAQRTLTQLREIRTMYEKLGVSLSPEKIKSLTESVAVTKTPDFAILKSSQDDTTKAVTAQTEQLIPRVDEILSNMGEATAITRNIERTREQIARGEASPIEIVGAINKAEQARQKLTKKGDVAAASAANEAINTFSVELAKTVGFGDDLQKALSIGMSKIPIEQITQRALSGIPVERLLQGAREYEQPLVKEPRLIDELIYSLGAVTAPGHPGTLSYPSMPGKVLPAQRKEFKALESSLVESAKLEKDGLFTTKNMQKGMAAALVIQSLNKKGTTRTIKVLEEQLAVQQSWLHELKKTANEAPMQGVEKEIATIKSAIGKEKQKGQFQSVTQTLLAVTGGTSLMANVLGVDQGFFTKMATGGAALYASMKLASEVLGVDLPSEAKEFGKTLKEAGEEYLSEGKIGKKTGATLVAQGQRLKSTTSSKFKEEFGQDTQAFQKQIAKQMATGEVAPVTEDELTSQLIANTEASMDNSTALKSLLAVLAYTTAGYVSEKGGPKQRLIELEKFSKAQAKVLRDFTKAFPEGTKMVFEEYAQGLEKAAKEGKESVVIEIRNQALETAKIYSDIESKLLSIIDSYNDAIKTTDSEIKKLQDSLAQLELFTEINTQLSQFRTALGSMFDDFNINREFTGPAILNRGLRGFPGVAELPMLGSELNPQQRIFDDLTEKFNNAVKMLDINLVPEEYQHYNEVEKFTGSIRESIAAFQSGFQASAKLTEQLSSLTQLHNQYRDSMQLTGKTYNIVGEQIGIVKQALTDLNNRLADMGQAFRPVVKFTEAIQNLENTFRDISVQEAVESMEGFRKYRDEFDKALGGSHPEALQMVSVMQQISAAEAGVKLGPVEPKTKVREAELIQQLRGSEGEQRGKLLRELSTLQDQTQLEIFERSQRQEDERLQRQMQPLEQMVTAIEKILQTEAVGGAAAGGLRSLQRDLINTMAGARTVISPDEAISRIETAIREGNLSRQTGMSEIDRLRQFTGNIYKGIDVTDVTRFSNAQNTIQKQLLQAMPTMDMNEMELSITNPIVAKLDEQLIVLLEIAKSSGVDIGTIEQRIDKAQSDRLDKIRTDIEATLAAGKKEEADYGRAKSMSEIRMSQAKYTTHEAIRLSERSGDVSIHERRSRPEYISNPEKRPLDFESRVRAYENIGSHPNKYFQGVDESTIRDFNRVMKDFVDNQNFTQHERRMGKGFNTGGAFQMFPSGKLNGPGTGTSDSITARVSSGEFIVNKGSVDDLEKRYGKGFLAHMNNYGDIPKMSKGGMLGGIKGFRKGGFFETSDDFWQDAAKKIQDKRMEFINDLSSGQVMSGKNKGQKLGILGGAINLGAQTGLTLAEVFSKGIGGVTGLLNLGESLTEGVTDAVAEKGFGGAALDAGLKTALASAQFTQYAMSGRLGDDIKNADYKGMASSLGSKLEEGIRTGGLFTSISAEALTTAVGGGIKNVNKLSKLGELEGLSKLGQAGALTGRVKPSSIPEAVDALKNVFEVNKYFSELTGVKFRFAKKGGNLDTIKRAANSLAEVMKDNPLVKEGVNIVGNAKLAANTPAAFNPASKAIKFSTNAIKKTPGALRKSLIKEHKSGFFQKAGIIDPIKALAAHESGHAVESALIGIKGSVRKALSVGGGKEAITKSIINAYGGSKEAALSAFRGAKAPVQLSSLYKKMISEGSEISRYATKGRDPFAEWIAEMFSAMTSVENGGDIRRLGSAGKYLDEFGKIVRPTAFAEGGLVDKASHALSIAWEYYFGKADKGDVLGTGNRFGQGQKGTSGYLKPGLQTLKELEKMTGEGMCGGGKIRKFHKGGPVGHAHYYTGNSEGYAEVDEEAYIKSLKNSQGPEVPAMLEKDEYVVNKEAAKSIGKYALNHMNTTGQLPGYQHRRYTVGSGPGGGGAGPSGPKARFGEVTARETNYRYMKEFMAEHEARMQSSNFKFKPMAGTKRVPLNDPRELQDIMAATTLGKAPIITAPAKDENYAKNLFGSTVAAARKKYGNVSADILSQYRKLKYALDNDPELAKAMGSKSADIYYGSSPSQKLSAIKDILSKSKSEWSSRDMTIADKILKDNMIAVAYNKTVGMKTKEQYGFDPRIAALRDPNKVSQFMKLRNERGSLDPEVQKLQKELMGINDSKAIMTHRILTNDKTFKQAKEIEEGILNRETSEEEFRLRVQQGKLAQLEAKEKFGTPDLFGPKKPGTSPMLFGPKSPQGLYSKPKFSGGGMIKKSGLVFAHGGEVILPKMQAGGLLDGAMGGVAQATMNRPVIRIEGGDELVAKITKAIESAKPQSVKVDTEGASVPIDTEGISVPIDATSIETIGTSISKSIEGALSKVSTDTGTSVGADTFDELKDLVTDVQDKIFVANDKIDNMKNDVDEKLATVITKQTLDAVVQDTVQNAISSVVRDVDISRNKISNAEAKIRQLDATYDRRINEVTRWSDRANDIVNGRI